MRLWDFDLLIFFYHFTGCIVLNLSRQNTSILLIPVAKITFAGNCPGRRHLIRIKNPQKILAQANSKNSDN